ncbi:MAG: efflux RND transporter periplasmic adaptor subunit [Acidobacteria bacterium]|nr:efflux RND transporter periplasmic adaptor subunit [Acidobacteriota bacterium]
MPRNILIGGAIVLTAGALVAVNLVFTRSDAPEVEVEAIGRRPLEAIVSAPGTIQPQLSVDMSASTMGRVTSLVVDEGDRVAAGQFLMQIDPENLQAQVTRGEAVLEAAESAYRSAQVAVETARVNLELAEENLERQENLWSLRLVAREVYDQAVAEVDVRETELRAREVDVEAAAQRIRQEQAMLDSARYDLTQVTITSPIDGIVTRRNIEEGETVVIGTMNNPGTVLLTIADFSILEAEIEVDETDIPTVELGQPAEITIDALPDRVYTGRVTEIGNSPIQPEAGAAQQEATNFLVVVTLDDVVPGVRPGFTCTAEITTATRTDALAVPIQATTVRDVVIDSAGNVVPPEPAAASGVLETPASASSSDGSGTLEEREGVFIVRQGRVHFTPVATGIAGERYFEALSGLDEGDLVVTGPFEIVRNLADGDAVDVDEREIAERRRETPPAQLVARAAATR